MTVTMRVRIGFALWFTNLFPAFLRTPLPTYVRPLRCVCHAGMRRGFHAYPGTPALTIIRRLVIERNAARTAAGFTANEGMPVHQPAQHRRSKLWD